MDKQLDVLYLKWNELQIRYKQKFRYIYFINILS